MTRSFSRYAILLILLLLTIPALAEETRQNLHPRVMMETSEGNIVLELDRAKAPRTVENFLQYVNDGFYDGTIFHRVIRDFMIQGGGYTTDFRKKKTRAPIPNEADNGLSNRRGTIAMARTSEPHSATAQFFINTFNNRHLDFRAPTEAGYGYAVFGKVISGINVVQRIQSLPIQSIDKRLPNVPQPVVVIKRVSIIEK
ncbi:MAG TPA: peptidyl-prolyl cis-trans isomerase [Gammaproteobacteria bacterium]|nr:peptidyl-prolyl cis-trans isomerase [Gammaproteobacteria bacterium]